ncbi:MAG: phage virion morphogenesis protein [Rubrivivax sp.]|nr:phage virion morphogenesis protein [Rubrivivax sp.]
MTAGIIIESYANGLEALGGAFSRMAAQGQHPRPIWEALGQYGESSTRMRFKNQAGPDRKRWVPSIRARQLGGQTLVQKARLLRSMSHNADNNGASWGTNVIHAGVHQFGAVIKAKSAGALRFRMPGGGFVTVKQVTIPARPYLGVNAEDGREMLALAHDAVDLAARKGGR